MLRLLLRFKYACRSYGFSPERRTPSSSATQRDLFCSPSPLSLSLVSMRVSPVTTRSSGTSINNEVSETSFRKLGGDGHVSPSFPRALGLGFSSSLRPASRFRATLPPVSRTGPSPY